MPKRNDHAMWLLAAAWPAIGVAQTGELDKILVRLSRLETENVALRQEVRELRSSVARIPGAAPVEMALPVEGAASPAPADATVTLEKVEIHERRIAEQAQSKVEASQRLPIKLTGMALMNVFHNTRHSGGLDTVVTASLAPGRGVSAATFRQSVLGFEYYGADSGWGGKVRGSLMLDFYDGTVEGTYAPARIRTASIEIGWTSRSLMVGIQKPIFNPREPNSLMQVGISPLTGSGNLWRWQPQIRFEQRVRLAPATELRAQIGALQTSEDFGVPAPAPAALRRRRPGLEGRFELAHKFDDTRRVEFAPGFHVSTSQFAGASIPSRLLSLDWFANPWSRLEFSGAFFNGSNVAHFGALRQGFRVLADGSARAISSRGGWGQFTYLATSRLSFNVYAGVHDDRNSDLARGGIGRNRSHAANVMYRLAPNVVTSFEALQTRTNYVGVADRLNNRYDLAVAYLF